MSEEIKKASTVVPRAMLSGLILNGVLGFAMMIAYLFFLGNLDDVLNAQETLGYPFLYVFQTGTGSTAGAAVMGLIVVALGVCSTVGSSRLILSNAVRPSILLISPTNLEMTYFVLISNH
ncbi:8aaf71af-d3db-4928-920d-4915cd5432f8 [Sclerotinia trifoliorum]|uniref:8aaf71af-d3db-4928-920d-4915cd5432f8 n=1 Tax=Sclerotinia trifoliorum TaxID=28548 RepID=A0A8H2VNP0_9HELO|nr:8aaf71af-d3db-4928-920d-4915cd5432f8 [Sclerotinia trifoliorum]